MKEPTAKVKYITAKKDTLLIDLLNQHLNGYISEKVIDSGGVWLNKKRIKNHHQIIKQKETLKVYLSPTQGYRYAISTESIIEETNDWVAVFKEPLVTIGMDRSNQYFNLMAGLNDHYNVTNMSEGVQPITRLDYRVSGIALFSKTKAAERKLFIQMQNRKIKKRYLALVSGTDYEAWYRVSNRLNSNYRAFQDHSGKIAKSAFIKEREIGGGTLFKVSTQTGRRHQIRCHAADYIAPLLNDELYGFPSKDHHKPIGLIASDIVFYWNKTKVQLSIGNNWVEWWYRILNR